MHRHHGANRFWAARVDVAPARAGRLCCCTLYRGNRAHYPELCCSFCWLTSVLISERGHLLGHRSHRLVFRPTGAASRRSYRDDDGACASPRRVRQRCDHRARLTHAYGASSHTAERGTGRTPPGVSTPRPWQAQGCLDLRVSAPQGRRRQSHIISTALVETGSRMDDVIFE